MAWSPSNSCKKAGLRAGRALHAAGLELRQAMFDLGQVEHQVVGPQAGPLADRRRLGRLQVREAQAGQVAMLARRTCASASITPTSRARDQLQRLAHQDQIGVVGDVAARRAQVDDRPGRRGRRRRRRGRGPSRRAAACARSGRRRAKSMSSTCGRSSAICCVRDRQAQLGLGLGQRDPQPPPGAELPLRAPQRGHLGRGVAADQRIVVVVVRSCAAQWSIAKRRPASVPS